MRYVAILLASLALTACGQGTPERSSDEMAQVAARAAELRPANTELASIYERSCMGCHGQQGSGAPLTGDGVAWAPRLAKGNDRLLNSTIHGFEGMPPLGLCPDCTRQDFRALIEFMSTDANSGGSD